MSQKNSGERRVKVETVAILVAVAFFVGVVVGVVGVVLKTPSVPQVTQIPSQGGNDFPQATSVDWSRRIQGLETLAEKDPSDVTAWVRLGNARFDSGAYEDAIEAYKKALNLAPGNADVLTDMGIAYRRTKRFNEAVEAFRKAAQIDATHLNSRYNLGVVLFHDLNDKEGAIEAWEDFLRVAPSGERAEQVKRMTRALRNM